MGTRQGNVQPRRWGRKLAAIAAVTVSGVAICGFAVAQGGPAVKPQAVPAAQAEVFVGITPTRVLDTRQAGGVAFGANDTRNLSLAAVVPPEATSAAINVTLDRASGETFVTVWPTGQPRPLASVNNAEPGQVTPNSMLAKLGTDRSISIFNERNSVDIIVDVVGYFVPLTQVTGAAMGPAVVLEPGTGGLPVGVVESTTFETVTSFTAPVAGSYLLNGYVDVRWNDETTVTDGADATASCRWLDGNNIELAASITSDVAGPPAVPGVDTASVAVPGSATLTAGQAVALECNVDQALPVGNEVLVTATFTAVQVGSIG
jgi:hypothetical protein